MAPLRSSSCPGIPGLRSSGPGNSSQSRGSSRCLGAALRGRCQDNGIATACGTAVRAQALRAEVIGARCQDEEDDLADASTLGPSTLAGTSVSSTCSASLGSRAPGSRPSSAQQANRSCSSIPEMSCPPELARVYGPGQHPGQLYQQQQRHQRSQQQRQVAAQRRQRRSPVAGRSKSCGGSAAFVAVPLRKKEEEHGSAPAYSFFRLFGLGQYARAFIEAGMEELEPIAHLRDAEALDLLESVQFYPGHRAKMLRALAMLRQAAVLGGTGCSSGELTGERRDEHMLQQMCQRTEILLREREEHEQQNQILQEENHRLIMTIRHQSAQLDAATSDIQQARQRTTDLEQLVWAQSEQVNCLTGELQRCMENASGTPLRNIGSSSAKSPNKPGSQGPAVERLSAAAAPISKETQTPERTTASRSTWCLLDQGSHALCQPTRDEAAAPSPPTTTALSQVTAQVDSQETPAVALPASADAEPAADAALGKAQGIDLLYLPLEIKGARVLQEMGDNYLVDNSQLKARTPGLVYRNSRNMEAKVADSQQRYPRWGEKVNGIMVESEDGQKWLQVKIPAKDEPDFNPERLAERAAQCLTAAIKNKLMLCAAEGASSGASRSVFHEDVFRRPKQKACGETLSMDYPTRDDIYDLVWEVMTAARMPAQVAVIALVFLDRLHGHVKPACDAAPGVALVDATWRRLVIACLLMAAKVWDDDAFDAAELAQLLPEMRCAEDIQRLESAFFDELHHNVQVSHQEYAKTCFLLQTLGGKDETCSGSMTLPSLSEDAVERLRCGTRESHYRVQNAD